MFRKLEKILNNRTHPEISGNYYAFLNTMFIKGGVDGNELPYIG
jgi:hypothetical protein